MKVIALDSLPLELQTAIHDGQVRTVCPSCQGGRSGEVSLSVRDLDEGIIKLSCWRASCGFYAVSFVDPGARLQSKKIKPGRPYAHKLKPVSGMLGATLALDYGLSPTVFDAHGWKQETNSETLVMPVRGPSGLIRGHTTRTFTTPKRVMAYKETAQPWLDWWRYCGQAKTVLVEDQLSACRLHALGYTAIALLGTSLSAGDVTEIQHNYTYDDVYLALDRDAYVKSLQLVKRHNHILRMLPVCLDEDIKNMDSDADICELFGDEYVRRDFAHSGDSRKQASV